MMKSYNSNIKSVFCRLVRSGCTYGHKCKFAHSSEELTPSKCYHGDKCLNDRCKYIHNGESKENVIERVSRVSTVQWFFKAGRSVKGPFPSATMRNWMQTSSMCFSHNLLISTNKIGPFSELVSLFPVADKAFTFDPPVITPTNKVQTYTIVSTPYEVDPPSRIPTSIKKVCKYTIGSVPRDIVMFDYSEKMAEMSKDSCTERLYPKKSTGLLFGRKYIVAKFNYELAIAKPTVGTNRSNRVLFDNKSTNFSVKGQKKSAQDMSIVDIRIRDSMDNWRVISDWKKDYVMWNMWESFMSNLVEDERIDFVEWTRQRKVRKVRKY